MDAEWRLYAGASSGTGTAMIFALPMLVIAGMAWFWPRAGGIMAGVWGLALVLTPLMVKPLLNHNAAASDNFYYLYYIFIFGGILHLLLPPQKVDFSDEWLKRFADVLTFGPLAVFIVLLTMGIISQFMSAFQGVFEPSVWGVIWFVYALIFAFFANKFPKVRGIMIIAAGGAFYSGSYMANYFTQFYLPLSIAYAAGGALHTIRAFQGKGGRSSRKAADD